MKRFILVLGALILFAPAFSQKSAYELKFKVKGVKDTSVYLANYFGSKLYYKDTAMANSKGEFVFTGKKELPAGKYAVITPGPKYFELFVQEQKFAMETDTTDFVKYMKVKNSPNNEFLYNYIHYVINKRLESEKLGQDLATYSADSALSNSISQQLVDLNKQVVEHQQNLVKDNPDLIAAKSLLLSIPVQIPDAPMREDGTRDSLFSYHYYLNHYFDNADLSDPNMVRLPEFQKKLDEYFNKVVMQIPDSINRYADRLIDEVRGNEELFKYLVQFVTNNFETSQIMGMDAVFLHMAEKYYLTGEATWADSTSISKIEDRVKRMKPTMLGNVTPSLTLADSTLEKWINVHEIEAPYTILFFYDPDCGHCKKKTPVMVEKFLENKSSGAVIIAVSGDDDDKWRKFIRDKGLDKEGIYNVTVPQKVYSDSKYATQLILDGKTDYKSLDYRNTYDIYTTPKVFLLDAEKKIVAKQIGVEQVFDIMNDIERRKKK